MPNVSSEAGYLTPTTPLPLDDEVLGRRLSNLVAGVTGLPGNLVRPRWQPDALPIPSPDVNWASVGVLGYPAVSGTPYMKHISTGDGYSEMDDPGDIRCLVTFYGPQCSGYGRLCRRALWVEQNWEQLKPLGIGLHDCGDVVIMPEKVNETWYRRADLTILLTQTTLSRYEIRNILSAQGVVGGSGASEETVEVSFDTENIT